MKMEEIDYQPKVTVFGFVGITIGYTAAFVLCIVGSIKLYRQNQHYSAAFFGLAAHLAAGLRGDAAAVFGRAAISLQRCGIFVSHCAGLEISHLG